MRVSVPPIAVLLAGALAFWVFGGLWFLQIISDQAYCRPIDLISPINEIDWTSLISKFENGGLIQSRPSVRARVDVDFCLSLNTPFMLLPSLC
jgi:hypothetical protein